MCWCGSPDAPSGPCQLSLATDPLLAGTETNVPGWKRQERPATWVRASSTSSWLAQVPHCERCDVGERVEGRESLWRSHSCIKVLSLGCLPSAIPCLLPFALSSPSCLIPPSPSSNHVFPYLFLIFNPFMCQFLHLWKSEADERGILGVFWGLHQHTSLWTWWIQIWMHSCVAYVCVTDGQACGAGEQPEWHMLYISPVIIISHSLLIMDQAEQIWINANNHNHTQTRTTHMKTGFWNSYYKLHGKCSKNKTLKNTIYIHICH